MTEIGFSKKLGSVDLRSRYDSLSSETKQEIESEVRRLLDEAAVRARTILTERRSELDLLTRALMEYETLTKDDIEKVIRGEKLDKLDISGKPDGGGSSSGGNSNILVPTLPIIPPDPLGGGVGGGIPPAAPSSATKKQQSES